MQLIRFILMLAVFAVSYWGGFLAYEGTLWLVWEQTLDGDLKATVFWSAVAYIIILVPLYLIVCFIIKSKVKHRLSRFLLYPVTCALTFVVPTTFILLIWGGGSLLSPEAQLFHSFFATSGFLFGLGFGLVSLLSSKRATGA